MIPSRFRSLSYSSGDLDLDLRNIDKMRRYSPELGCVCVPVVCRECGDIYAEEWNTAKAKRVSNCDFLCIRHDKDAEERVTVSIPPVVFIVNMMQ